MPAGTDVSVTAFIVNASRARLEALSGDIYAKLWVTDETKRLWDEFSREVYPYDDVNLSLRHRFFLDHLKDFTGKYDNPLFVNIAAGLTSYPFLLDKPCRCVETDFPHVIKFKKEKILRWQQDGIVPPRETEYYPLNLENKVARERFVKKVFRIGYRPAIVIMEGLLYYLTMDTINALFKLYETTLPAGSLVIFDFWGPDADTYPVVRNLMQYLSKSNAMPSRELTYLDMQYISGIEGFNVIEHTDIAALERKYAESRVLQDRDNRFPGEYIVLGRQSWHLGLL
jgi:O-methyltransferase involved in polyketide biosynthesis